MATSPHKKRAGGSPKVTKVRCPGHGTTKTSAKKLSALNKVAKHEGNVRVDEGLRRMKRKSKVSMKGRKKMSEGTEKKKNGSSYAGIKKKSSTDKELRIALGVKAKKKSPKKIKLGEMASGLKKHKAKASPKK